jgi:hypothetical protein
MIDENVHHTDGENPDMVVEKPKLRNFTSAEVLELVEQYLLGWKKTRGTWLNNLFHRVWYRRRHYMRLICTDSDDKKSFNLLVQVGISRNTSIHSKMTMLTAKWLLDMFIQNVSRNDARTLEMINSLPFVALTKEDLVYGDH